MILFVWYLKEIVFKLKYFSLFFLTKYTVQIPKAIKPTIVIYIKKIRELNLSIFAPEFVGVAL